MARGNVLANYKRATYIGFVKTSCEHRFIDENKIVSPRRLMRLPGPEGWSSAILGNITIPPWKVIGGDGAVRVAVGESVPVPGRLEGELKKGRGFHVLPQMLREFWYTQGCAQCNRTLVLG